MSQELLFVAVVLPDETAAQITDLKYYCAEHFASRKALNSPPHITLQPPFKLPSDDKPQLLNFLQEFAKNCIEFTLVLENFNCFKQRVIYVDAPYSPELTALQSQLKQAFIDYFLIKDERYGDRPFHPHVTIAFKDLTKNNFERAWQEFKARSVYHQFIVEHLTLLRYHRNQWQIDQQFQLAKQA